MAGFWIWWIEFFSKIGKTSLSKIRNGYKYGNKSTTIDRQTLAQHACKSSRCLLHWLSRFLQRQVEKCSFEKIGFKSSYYVCAFPLNFLFANLLPGRSEPDFLHLVSLDIFSIRQSNDVFAWKFENRPSLPGGATRADFYLRTTRFKMLQPHQFFEFGYKLCRVYTQDSYLLEKAKKKM